jgi:hypothetical protein
MRDIDTGTGGHNTDFLTNIANNIWLILNPGQKDRMIALAREQAEQLQELARKRYPIIKAFHRMLEGDVPSGSVGLDRQAVQDYCAGVFEFDGTLAFKRATDVWPGRTFP